MNREREREGEGEFRGKRDGRNWGTRRKITKKIQGRRNYEKREIMVEGDRTERESEL